VPPELQAAREIRVSSTADSGPGSLREAIFAADRAGGRARLLIEVNQIVLESLLPPLINPDGIVIDAGSSRCEINAAALTTGPAIDVAAPNSLINGLRIRGASGQAILLRTSGTRLQSVAVRESTTAVYLAPGADDLRVQDAEFESNAIGVHVPPAATRVSIRNCHFRKHTQAAIWAVSPPSLLAGNSGDIKVQGNRFEHDYRGVVLMHMRGWVEGNQFSCAQMAGIYLSGAGAVIRGNRIHAGKGFGIFADATEGIPIEDNEVDHNCAGGVLLRDARNTVVRSNRVYGNGYGIVVVFGSKLSPNAVAGNLLIEQRQDGLYVVGGSPVLRSNQVWNSGGASLRILDFIPKRGTPTASDPLLEANRLSGNGSDAPVHGTYRMASSSLVAPPQSPDCSWVNCGEKSVAGRDRRSDEDR